MPFPAKVKLCTESLQAPSPSPSVPPLPEGEALAGRATFYWTTEARYGVKGRASLQRAAASGQRSLSSCRWPRQRSTTVSGTSCFARPDESCPTCQWLPLWGSWRAQARLRGQGCCQTALALRSYRSDEEPAYRCAAALRFSFILCRTTSRQARCTSVVRIQLTG